MGTEMRRCSVVSAPCVWRLGREKGQTHQGGAEGWNRSFGGFNTGAHQEGTRIKQNAPGREVGKKGIMPGTDSYSRLMGMRRRKGNVLRVGKKRRQGEGMSREKAGEERLGLGRHAGYFARFGGEGVVKTVALPRVQAKVCVCVCGGGGGSWARQRNTKEMRRFSPPKRPRR